MKNGHCIAPAKTRPHGSRVRTTTTAIGTAISSVRTWCATANSAVFQHDRPEAGVGEQLDVVLEGEDRRRPRRGAGRGSTGRGWGRPERARAAPAPPARRTAPTALAADPERAPVAGRLERRARAAAASPARRGWSWCSCPCSAPIVSRGGLTCRAGRRSAWLNAVDLVLGHLRVRHGDHVLLADLVDDLLVGVQPGRPRRRRGRRSGRPRRPRAGPRAESTKSRNSLAVFACGAFAAMPMPRGRTTVPSSRKRSPGTGRRCRRRPGRPGRRR